MRRAICNYGEENPAITPCRVECKGDTLTCGVIDFSENANQGAICQTVDVPSLATRPRSVKIPISLLRSRTRARVRLLRHRYPTSIPHRVQAAGDMRISRDFRASANGQCIYTGRGRRSLLGRDFARGNARERSTGSRRQNTGLPIRGSTMRERRIKERKVRAPVSKRSAFSITIDGRAFLRPLSPLLRDRKADFDAKSYLLAYHLARARETPCLQKPSGASNVCLDFTARGMCLEKRRGSFLFLAWNVGWESATCGDVIRLWKNNSTQRHFCINTQKDSNKIFLFHFHKFYEKN